MGEKEKIKLIKLVTERLILRPLTIKDLKDLVRNINNLKVSRYLVTVPYPYTLKDARLFLKHCAKSTREKPRTSYEFSIELKSERKIIGGVALSKVDRYQGLADIGYWLGESYWRQGIVSEAVERVIDFAFRKLRLRRLEASIFAENKASQRLVKKLGFKRECRLKKLARARSTGKIHDEIVYSLFKERWK